MKSNCLKGFTLIELLIVITIIALLTAIVTVNFVELRSSQEVSGSARDLISKIRQIQNLVLSGQIQGGATPQAYEITFNEGAQTYLIQYDIGGVLTTLETVSVSQSGTVKLKKIYVGGVAKTQSKLRLTSPLGTILVDGAANQSVQIDLQHLTAAKTQSVVIDGISGRIGLR